MVVIRVFWMVAQAVGMVFFVVIKVFLVIDRVPWVTSWVSLGTTGYHKVPSVDQIGPTRYHLSTT